MQCHSKIVINGEKNLQLVPSPRAHNWATPHGNFQDEHGATAAFEPTLPATQPLGSCSRPAFVTKPNCSVPRGVQPSRLCSPKPLPPSPSPSGTRSPSATQLRSSHPTSWPHILGQNRIKTQKPNAATAGCQSRHLYKVLLISKPTGSTLVNVFEHVFTTEKAVQGIAQQHREPWRCWSTGGFWPCPWAEHPEQKPAWLHGQSAIASVSCPINVRNQARAVYLKGFSGFHTYLL